MEYAVRDDDDRGNGYSPDRRGRDVSPHGRGYRGRSPSPYRRDRGSPDYGRGANPDSRYEPRGSPNYERAESPVNERYHRFLLLQIHDFIFKNASHGGMISFPLYSEHS